MQAVDGYELYNQTARSIAAAPRPDGSCPDRPGPGWTPTPTFSALPADVQASWEDLARERNKKVVTP